MIKPIPTATLHQWNPIPKKYKTKSYLKFRKGLEFSDEFEAKTHDSVHYEYEYVFQNFTFSEVLFM